MKIYKAAEEKRINKRKKIGVLRRAEADKKLRSILFLALGNEGKKVFSQKNLTVKNFSISFKEFWDLLGLIFDKPPDVTIERYFYLKSDTKNRESLEQFLGALTDLARTCNIRESNEAARIRDVIICNMRNSETQLKLLSATISPSEDLSQALKDEKGYFNHQKLTNTANSTNGQASNHSV